MFEITVTRLVTALSTGNTLQHPQRSVRAFPWKPQKGLEAVGMANKCVKVYLANNQTDHKGKKYIKRGKKLWSPLGKLLNVSNRGMFGFVRIKDVEGLLGAAQNVEEKWLLPLCGICELMDGSGQFGEPCAQHGHTPQAGQGWFIRVPLEGAHSSVRQL